MKEEQKVNDFERSQARRFKENQDNMKDPAYAAAYEAAQRRKKERERSEEILKYYSGNGCLPPSLSEEKPEKKPRTAEQMRMDDILRHFS